MSNERGKTRGFFMKAATVFFMLMVLGTAGLFAQTKPVTALSSEDGKTVFIPAGQPGGEAKFFSFTTARGVTVRFFAILDGTGKIHVAFDACDVCYQAKKGYRVVSGFAVCNNCGSRFPLAAIGRDNQTGGCWPSFLPVTVSGASVAVRVADLEKKQYLFPM